MIQRLAKAAVVVALASSIGLHWAFFQSLAWVGMLVSYSQEATITEALVKTFDGKHPCALCQEIVKGKQSEKKSDQRPDWKKFEFSYSAAVFVFNAPSQFWKVQAPEFFADSLAHSPPVPPPRFHLS